MSQKLKSITILLVGLILLVSCSNEKKEVLDFNEQSLLIREKWEDNLEFA